MPASPHRRGTRSLGYTSVSTSDTPLARTSQGVLRVAASAGMQQVLDAAGLTAAALKQLEHNSFEPSGAAGKREISRVSTLKVRAQNQALKSIGDADSPFYWPPWVSGALRSSRG